MFGLIPKTGTMTGGLHEEITLPHTQEWELYNNSLSLCSKKVRVCMAELGLDYRNHPINVIETGSYQNVSRAFLAINPGGLVPVLVHRGHPIYESHDEIIYAAQHAGARGRELLPENPETRALVESWVDSASLVGNDPRQGMQERAGSCMPGISMPLFTTMVHYIPYRKIAFGLLFHPHKERPLIFGTLKMRGIHQLPGPIMQLVNSGRKHMGDHLDKLGAHLTKTGGPWIAGDGFTLADVSWVVILDRLCEADWDGYFWGDGRRPVVAAYWERLQQRPSYTQAITSMRDMRTLRGMEDLKRAKREYPTLRAALEGSA